AKSKTERLTIRGSTYSSPYGSFEAYLSSALEEDLSQAGLLSDQSDTLINTTLVRNELDGSGFSQGYAEIEARFEVKRAGNVVYDRSKVARQEWPSSVLGPVAIPRAAQNYPIAVQNRTARAHRSNHTITDTARESAKSTEPRRRSWHPAA